MKTRQTIPISERSGRRWPFQRRSTAWLPTLPMTLVAQPSRLRVRAASRRSEEHGAGRPMDSQAKTPALRPQSRLRGSLRSSHVRASLALCLLGGFLTALGQDPWLVNTNYPMDTNASLGATVSFRVYADSTNLPLTCQWQHEGTNLPAATSYQLVITNVTVAHAGGYMAMISNAIGGFTNSRTATLTVHPAQFKDVTVSAGVTNAPGYCISAAWGDYNNVGGLQQRSIH